MEDAVKQRIKTDAARIVRMDRLWRDPAARERFEQDSGLAPIDTGNSLEVEQQHQSGRTWEYHAKFREWALAKTAEVA